MSGRRSRGRRAQPRFPSPHLALSDEQELVVAQSLRRSCDDCGSAQLVWGDVAGAIFAARTDAQRRAFREALEQGVGPAWPAWWCPTCDDLGFFLPAHL